MPLNRLNPPQQLAKASRLLCHGTSRSPTTCAVSIGLRNCYVARFQLPPQAPQAVSLGLRNCYVARFEHPLKASKASKAPQQLSKAFEPQNPPQQLAKASRLLCHGTSRGPTSCFYIGLRNSYVATGLTRPHELFLLGFETATWHVLSIP